MFIRYYYKNVKSILTQTDKLTIVFWQMLTIRGCLLLASPKSLI